VKLDRLKETLSIIFGTRGQVIDIVAKKNVKAKGQAFVVFENPDDAAVAVDLLHGFEIFGQPMHLALAHTRSDAIVVRTGTEEEFDLHKRRRMAEKGP
jgi:RNA recognition motif-containing protein